MNIEELQKQLNLPLHVYGADKVQWVVYCLIDNENIVYIGKSSHRRHIGRIKSHAKNKSFDSYCVIPVLMNEQDCYTFEAALISLVRPKYNKEHIEPDLKKVAKGWAVFESYYKYSIDAYHKLKHKTLVYLISGALLFLSALLVFCMALASGNIHEYIIYICGCAAFVSLCCFLKAEWIERKNKALITKYDRFEKYRYLQNQKVKQ
jgi:hypothetical protein